MRVQRRDPDIPNNLQAGSQRLGVEYLTPSCPSKTKSNDTYRTSHMGGVATTIVVGCLIHAGAKRDMKAADVFSHQASQVTPTPVGETVGGLPPGPSGPLSSFSDVYLVSRVSKARAKRPIDTSSEH